MTNTVNNTQNNQQVNLNSFKVGQKINSCNTQKKKSIFNAIDKNNDGVISKDEMQGVVKGKVKNKEGKLVEKEYLKLKDMGEGRSLVVDANGKQWVRAKDGTILKDSYVKSGFKKTTNTPQKPATNSQRIAAANLGKAYKHAEAAFNKQLKDDGWAEDVADGISKLWNNDLFGGGTGNTASQVRKEMQAEKKRVLALQKAAKQSDSAFRTQFKKIYGVDYNQAAVDAYNKNPNEANYKKAFGTKIESIEQRVARYNQSQQTGGAAVKTGTKVAGGIAVGVATGGTGFVALGATALGTAAVSVAVEESDRANVTGTYKDASGKTVKQKGAFKEGTDHGKIFKDAAWDGAGVLAGGAVGAVAGKVVTGTTKAAIAGRAAINIGGDVAMGAAQEYAETGEVTASGVITNAAMSGIGSAVTSGVLKGFKKVKKGLGNVADNVSQRFSAKKADIPHISNSEIKSNISTVSEHHTSTSSPIGHIPSESFGGYSANKGSTLIPHNAQIIPVSDNLSVMTTDSGLAIYKKNGKFPSKVCKLELGESCIIGKDSSGNNLVAMRDNTGNTFVSVEKPHTEVDLPQTRHSSDVQTNRKEEILQTKTSEQFVTSNTSTSDRTTPDIGTASKNTTKAPVHELPIKENIDIGDNKVVRRINENELSLTLNGKIPERFTIEPGKRKIITDKFGDSYIISHNSQTGKMRIQKKVDVNTQISSRVASKDNPVASIDKQHVEVEPTPKHSVNTNIEELDVNSSRAFNEPQKLIDLRNSNPTKYNQLTKESISNLRKTNPAAYDRLEKAGVITVLKADPDASISPRLLKAIQLESQGKSLVTKLPNGAKLSNISTYVDNGEVCSLGGKLYINNNGNAERLNLSPEKFEQLFPPVESSIIIQDTNACDCWLLSQIAGQMESPNGRVKLYKRFRQEGNDIYVSMPNVPDVKFPNGKVISAPGIQTQTCDGLKMIEMTQAVHRLSTFSGERNVHFESLYEKGTTDAVDINSKLTPTKKHWYSKAKAEMDVNELLKRLNNGQLGSYHKSQKIYTRSIGTHDRDNVISILEKFANDPNSSITCGTGSYMGFKDSMLGGHATRITGYDGQYVYLNDQIQMGGSAIARKIPLEAFMKNALRINYTNFDTM